MRRLWTTLGLGLLAAGAVGCHHPSITAVSLSPHVCTSTHGHMFCPKEPEGIPFYLPKPLLIISKNFRNIEETKVGLTDSAPIPNYYDDQAKYADLNARTNFVGPGNVGDASAAKKDQTQAGDPADPKTAAIASANIYSENGAPVSPGALPEDGLKPEAFFTYHIVFVPDLTQKYGLKVKGGAGEIRAAMNLVNGWQFTGLGPYYMKDSSTAQNTLAGGITANLAASGVADVVRAVATLRPGVAPGANGGTQGGEAGDGVKAIEPEQVQIVADALRQLNPKFVKIPAYAQISIYEPYLSELGTMEWKLIAQQDFDRDVVATDFAPADVLSMLRGAAGNPPEAAGATDAPDRGPQDNAGGGGPRGGSSPGGGQTQSGLPPLPGMEPSPFEGAARDPRLPSMSRDESPLGSPEPAEPLNTGKPDVLPPVGAEAGVDVPLSWRRMPGPGGRIDPGVIRTRQDDSDEQTPGGNDGGIGPVLLELNTNEGNLAAPATSNSRPTFRIRGVAPGTTIVLQRDGKPVSPSGTFTSSNQEIMLQDQQELTRGGRYEYQVARVVNGRDPEPLGGALMVTFRPRTQAGATPVGVAPVTPSDAMVNGAMQRVFDQFASVAGPAPTTVAAPPAAPPATGNQVTLNQYFGNPKLGRSGEEKPRHRFGLFHHKKEERPTIRTLTVDATDRAS